MKAPKLNVVDYLPFRMFCADSRYLYGVKAAAAGSMLYRVDISDGTETAIYDFSFGYSYVYGAWTTSVPGELFVQVYNISDYKYRLFRSVDYGEHFGSDISASNGNYVFCIGSLTNTPDDQIPNVTLLGRGFCELNNRLYIGEYNVNQERTPGGKNDAISVLVSSDRGVSWERALTWNTDGSKTNVRHIHGVVTDGNDIYIATGDLSKECGILKWDGVSELQDNLDLANYQNCQHGSQRYRTGDIIFPPGEYAYYMVDSHTPDVDRGIFKIHKSMQFGSERICDKIVQFPHHSGWYGLVLDSKTMIFTEFLERDSDDSRINFYATGDGGETWDIVGTFHGFPGTYGGGELFQCSQTGNIYYSRRGVGKDYHNCTVLKQGGLHRFEKPDILHPVFWVNKNGSDVGDAGKRPSNAWATPGYALKGKICPGARVIIGPGKYEEGNSTIITYNQSLPYPGVTGTETVIEGAGKDVTTMSLPESATAHPLMTVPAEARPIAFKNIKLASDRALTDENIIVNSAGGDESTTLSIIDAVVGDKNIQKANVLDNRGQLFISRSDIYNLDGQGVLINPRKNSITKVVNSYLSGGSGVVACSQENASIDIDHCIFDNYRLGGVRMLSGSTIAPSVKNSVFLKDGVAAYVDGTGLTETDENIDYNYYTTALPTAANGGGSHSITGGNIAFIDMLSEDFRIVSGSLLDGKGVATSTLLDRNGVEYRNPPSIGMFEASRPEESVWVTFSGSLPPLSLAPSAPAKLLEVQVWDKVVDKDEINKI